MNQQNLYDQTVQNTTNNLRIIACAGSGKTTFIAKRITHLLQNGYSPQNIIAFTYTERGAAELNNKIVEQLKKAGIFDNLRAFADMFIGTIHGWCLKALMDNEIGFQKFSVLDEIKLRLFVDKNYKKIGMTKVEKLTNPNIKMKIFTDTDRFIQLMNIVRESEIQGNLPPKIQQAKEQYEKTLIESAYFDFTMIMVKALEKLKDFKSDLAEKLKQELKFLIIDEYQDINPIQNNIVQTIHHISNCKVTVVGDDDQNIFHWRGSNNKFLQNFDKDFTSVLDFTLDTNYRSSRGITNLASRFIEHNKNRLHKEMKSAEKQDFVKDEDILYEEFENIQEENEEITRKINSLRGVKFTKDDETRGLDYSDFCILLRTWKKAKSITELLDEYNIPYITAGVNELFDQREVVAAIAIYEYLQEQITSNQLKSKWLDISNNNIIENLLDVAIDNLEKWKPEQFQQHRKSISWGEYKLQEIFWNFLSDANIVEETFINSHIDGTKEKAELIFYNLGQFSQVLNDYESIYLASAKPGFYLFNFLNFIRYAADGYYPEGWLNNPYKTPNAVQIMTIHQSKGLEFPVVFIPGLNMNYLPIKKVGGLKVWHFLDSKIIEDYERYEPNNIDRIEDERRLLYVALTRSQKFLFLSRAPENNRLYKKKSQFYNEFASSPYIVEPLKKIDFTNRDSATPQPKKEDISISLNFSVLKDFFDCHYRFKLITVYGFCFPLNQRMGMGKSLHDSLMTIHKKLSEDQTLDDEIIKNLVKEQYHFPYIGNSIKLKELKEKVEKKTIEYYNLNKGELEDINFYEQDIKLNFDKNIFVSGRIDLIKTTSLDGEPQTTILEFKSNDKVQTKSSTVDQLNLYALGYKELEGENPDYIQVYDVEENKKGIKSPVNQSLLDETENRIKDAAKYIRNQNLNKIQKESICKNCYQLKLCKARIDLNISAKK